MTYIIGQRWSGRFFHNRDGGQERVSSAGEISTRFLDNIETVVYGKREEIKLVLTALICDGHVLLEDVPDGEDDARPAIAGSIEGATTSRIQCTPDLQPTDVTGLAIFDQRSRDFEFRPGPIFTNVVLVDEINRATPKTQSALLEAMAEHQVTADGVTRELPYPFLLLATENPIEYEGTFPLPEAQLDRFFLGRRSGTPTPRTSSASSRSSASPSARRSRAGGRTGRCPRAPRAAQQVYVDDVLHRWLVELVRATREQDAVVIGSSVRGSLALERAARAWALLHGRGYVIPEDIELLFVPVLVHRVVFTPSFVAKRQHVGLGRCDRGIPSRLPRGGAAPGSEDDPTLRAQRGG